MAENSAIEWTTHTSNFWWGCFKVSDGCKNCYAETWANRWGKSIWGPPSTTKREYKKAAWRDVPKWDKQARAAGVRHRVFVQSMADFFEDHPQVIQWRRDAMALMSQCTNLDFQVLTKRPENIGRMMPLEWCIKWPDHIWAGTSVENQATADERIPHLLEVPARVRFLSMEPLLGPVNLDLAFYSGSLWPGNGIQWVIVGGESGPGKRPMNLAWARSIRDQCKAAGVPFFMKQIDKVQPIPTDLMIREMPS